MTRKKAAKGPAADAGIDPLEKKPSGASISSDSIPLSAGTPSPSIRFIEPTTSSLIICRNKHWRYISSFHGPWLQLPPEILESIAFSNFSLPRPQVIDPATLFDLVKIRRLVDDATDLAVRAANGTTSSALHNAHNSSNGLYGGGNVAALGLGIGVGHGANARLSKERRSRMREHATQKLSHAYHLDEIAASVATMQSASALEDVAKHVLVRNSTDPDAKYVHFFHEKIPSRSLAECTSLLPLDQVIEQRPTHGAPLRTRAVTKIFKEDFPSAVTDLSEALRVCRLYSSQHEKRNDQAELVLARDVSHRRRTDVRVEESDQPSSLEGQILFHRAGTYLTMACDQILLAMHGIRSTGDSAHGQTASPSEEQADQKRQQSRKLVRTYAKRALRDYNSFISRFDYSPGQSVEISRAFFAKVNAAANGNGKRYTENRLLQMADFPNSARSSAMIQRRKQGPSPSHSSNSQPRPSSAVYRLNELFAAVPPSDLPVFPAESTALAKTTTVITTQVLPPLDQDPDYSETLTYHPLLTDALHSLLLCHCLIQTSPKELLRHANMVARLTRISDGFPVFLAARSPARADWVEVLRRCQNWLGLAAPWDVLCSPPLLPGQQQASHANESKEERRERQRKEAIRDALADERVVDEETFRKSVRAREMRAVREEEEEIRLEYLRTKGPVDKPATFATTNGTKSDNADQSNSPNHGEQSTTSTTCDDTKERDYPITTERADAISRWIREAPALGADTGSSQAASGTGASKKARGLKKSAVGLGKNTSETTSPLEGFKGTVNGDENDNGTGKGGEGLEKSMDCLSVETPGTE